MIPKSLLTKANTIKLTVKEKKSQKRRTKQKTGINWVISHFHLEGIKPTQDGTYLAPEASWAITKPRSRVNGIHLTLSLLSAMVSRTSFSFLKVCHIFCILLLKHGNKIGESYMYLYKKPKVERFLWYVKTNPQWGMGREGKTRNAID